MEETGYDLYWEYQDIANKHGYTPIDLAALSNLLGRQGTREYLGYHLRDGKPLGKVLPKIYGKRKKQKNKTPDEYIRIFREGVTHAPPFMIANLIRGDMAGFVTVDAPLRPMIDTLGGLKNALNDTETIKEMKLIAGVGGYACGYDYRDTAALVKRQMRARHRGYKIIDSPGCS